METQSPKRSVPSSVQRMGDTVAPRDVPRRYGPAARVTSESRRVSALRARLVVQDRAHDLLAAGDLDGLVTYLAPLVGLVDAAPATGSLETVLANSAIADLEQDVAREKFRRGDLSRPQYRYHLLRQLAHTYAELARVSHD